MRSDRSGRGMRAENSHDRMILGLCNDTISGRRLPRSLALPRNDIKRVAFLVIPNQCAHWCGNPLSCGSLSRAMHRIAKDADCHVGQGPPRNDIGVRIATGLAALAMTWGRAAAKSQGQGRGHNCHICTSFFSAIVLKIPPQNTLTLPKKYAIFSIIAIISFSLQYYAEILQEEIPNGLHLPRAQPHF